jgi:hypothetical protein
MKQLAGLEIQFDISQMIKICDLITFEGPLLSHYMTSKGENYLFKWVDTDGINNRWMFFRVDLNELQKYINKEISLFELVTNCLDYFVYFVDIDSEINYHNICIVSIDNIENDYMPEIDSIYEFTPTDAIDLNAFSQKYNSGILELRITGENVKYGSIPLTKFAPIVPKIEDIRKELAGKFIKERKRKINIADKEKKAINGKILSLETQYEVMYALAGSFRLILKPTGQQLQLPDTVTFADEFAEEMVGLFNAGYSKDTLELFIGKYNKNLIKKYNDFILYLHENKLGLDIKWANNNSKQDYKQKIKVKDTDSILKNLSDFQYNENEDLKYRGRFYAINTRSGSYAFESTEGDDFKSTGLFDSKVRNLIFQISFNKEYDVVIERQTSEKVGEKEKIKDTLVSYIENNTEQLTEVD